MHRVLVPEFGRVFAEIKIVNLEKLPIRLISFVTPRENRNKLLDETKNYYRKFLETSKVDTFLYFIESRLMKEHKPDVELVKKHNADPLYKDWEIPGGALWEQSDVVHDILAFLGEQMIEMNKEKQKEIKGYLEWIEGQLKIQPDIEGITGIETLTGKTQIKNYLGDYQKGKAHLAFEDFWKILEKNKVRIQANLKSRELYENIRSEYEKSLSKLLPLKEKLRKTGWLIDQIVYKLYGLTEAEIKIVEGKGVMGVLKLSILDKAFRGEPVAQDPTDEPASVLLERLREKKARMEAEEKRNLKQRGLKIMERKRRLGGSAGAVEVDRRRPWEEKETSDIKREAE